MLTPNRRSALILFGLLLFLPVVLLQTRIDPLRHQYEPENAANANKAMGQLPVEFALGALTGFKEAVAGLLWVRTDEFFHDGNYDAITPMLRIITWLDPHQLDVYETGAWHMDYNFTDADQRSDRRYIPLSIAFLEEGIKNNPNVTDIRADLAFTHYYRKIADFPKAAQTFEAAQALAQDLAARAAQNPGDKNLHDQAEAAATSVTTVGHGLAHAYEAQGEIDKALRQWQYCLDGHRENLAKKRGNTFGDQAGISTAQNWLRRTQLRAKWRPQDIKPPIDMALHAQIKRVAPRVFVVSGTLNSVASKNFVLETGKKQWVKSGEDDAADGCRVEVRLQDAGYKKPVIDSFSLSSLNLDPTVTIMQEAASVRKGKFQRKIDMSQDPGMYSFTAPKYTVTFWFNPSNPNDCPPQVQDRIGWLGEGMTDARYLDVSGLVPGDTSTPIPGLRQLKKTITLTRADLLGQGEKVFE